MKTTNILFMAISILIVASCSPLKKSTASAAPATPSSTPTPASDDYLFTTKPADGINVPGDAELTALKVQYKELTLEKLKEGHAVYTGEACTGCHNPKNIYRLDVTNWRVILDDMALRANLSEAQKDAVYKYVLSIKATQPK